MDNRLDPSLRRLLVSRQGGRDDETDEGSHLDLDTSLLPAHLPLPDHPTLPLEGAALGNAASNLVWPAFPFPSTVVQPNVQAPKPTTTTTNPGDLLGQLDTQHRPSNLNPFEPTPLAPSVGGEVSQALRTNPEAMFENLRGISAADPAVGQDQGKSDGYLNVGPVLPNRQTIDQLDNFLETRRKYLEGVANAPGGRSDTQAVQLPNTNSLSGSTLQHVLEGSKQSSTTAASLLGDLGNVSRAGVTANIGVPGVSSSLPIHGLGAINPHDMRQLLVLPTDLSRFRRSLPRDNTPLTASETKLDDHFAAGMPVPIPVYKDGGKPPTPTTGSPELRLTRTFSQVLEDAASVAASEPDRGDMAKLKHLMNKSEGTQQALQEWDKKNGLPKSHSCTMVKTSRSRRQLLEGRILPKWDGSPLITDDPKDKPVRRKSKKRSLSPGDGV